AAAMDGEAGLDPAPVADGEVASDGVGPAPADCAAGVPPDWDAAVDAGGGAPRAPAAAPATAPLTAAPETRAWSSWACRSASDLFFSSPIFCRSATLRSSSAIRLLASVNAASRAIGASASREPTAPAWPPAASVERESFNWAV